MKMTTRAQRVARPATRTPERMWRLAALFALLLPQVAGATSCATVSFEGSAFTTCEVSASRDNGDSSRHAEDLTTRDS